MTFSCSLLHDETHLPAIIFGLRTTFIAAASYRRCYDFAYTFLFYKVYGWFDLVLHSCFRFITFSCPISSEPLKTCAVLLCVGYQIFLQTQFSSICKMWMNCWEIWLTLRHPNRFYSLCQWRCSLRVHYLILWDLNAAIAKRYLHLIIQEEREEIIGSLQLWSADLLSEI